jgi:hypothetical protein
MNVTSANPYRYTLNTSTPGQVNLVVTLVPEPSCAAAAGLLASACLLRRRAARHGVHPLSDPPGGR